MRQNRSSLSGSLTHTHTHTESTPRTVQRVHMWPQEVLYHIICLPPGNDTQNCLLEKHITVNGKANMRSNTVSLAFIYGYFKDTREIKIGV